MADSTRESEIILHDARRSLEVQQEGGFHRRSGRRGPSIGRGSAEAKARHYARMIKRVLIACAAILVAAIAAGLVIGGLGFGGVMTTFFALVAAVVLFSQFPRIKVPKRADLTRTQDARQLVARTELWLEHQRPALPAPAVTLVDQLGVQLDALGMQLEHVDPNHPAAAETRKLVGEHLPEMVDTYRKIPAQLRREERAGATPEAQLVDGLGRISDEIDRVTRQLADGVLDDLAIRSRYLEYRYGNGDVSVDPIPTENR
jgi:hypothetical protein